MDELTPGMLDTLLARLRASAAAPAPHEANHARIAPIELTCTGRVTTEAEPQQALQRAHQDRAQQTRARARAALRRYAQGRYGLCLHCGEAIAAARLHIDPAATACAACARAAESAPRARGRR